MLQEIADKAYRYGQHFLSQGAVADYIPELGKANPDNLGLCIMTLDGECVTSGDVDTRFSIQSICKVITLSLALQTFGFNEVFSHVMMEPSGDAFNSILKLDIASNRPFNPMINAGAIEIVSLLAQKYSFDELLGFARTLTMDPDIVLNESVYNSEFTTGDRNRAIGYLLKSKGVLEGDVLSSVDLYFKMCSLNVNAKTLAGLASVLANDGINPKTNERLIDSNVAKTVKTLMLTCGMYDGSGEYAVKVGMPAKSGVGGGIMSVSEGRLGIGTYGPSLDPKGNSIGGLNIMEYLSKELHLHIFDSASLK